MVKVPFPPEFPHNADHFEIKHQHMKDKFSKPPPKRIIICCDGTWQSAVSGHKNVPSNITRLCRAINPVGIDANGDQWQQVVWYDSGVGTTSLTMGTAIEGATGQGLEGNVIEAYNFCVLNYNVGDQIMVFGFSRGAYTARTIAGVITDIGICKKNDLNKFPELWTIYKEFKTNTETRGKRFYHSEAWFKWLWGMADVTQGAGDDKNKEFMITKGNSAQPFLSKDWIHKDGEWAQEDSRNVEVVGVYDTVGAIGMPEVGGVKIPQWMLFWQEKPDWHNVGLSTHIKHAFQALAIDEKRKAFEPTLFYVPPKKTNRKEEEDLKKELGRKKAIWEQKLKVAEDLKKGVNGDRPTDAAINKAATNVNDAALKWNTTLRHLVNYQDRLKPQTKLAQVWFPGYHINIGGGSTDTMNNEGNMEEMSNIAYAWMLDQVKKHISLNESYIEDEYTAREENFTTNNNKREKWDEMTKAESWGAWGLRNMSQKAIAVVHPRTPGPEPPFKKQRYYDWGTGDMSDSYTPMYRPNGQHIRKPGRYAFKDDKREASLGETFEYIHPVVQYRIEQTKKMEDTVAYMPSGPEFHRRLVNKAGASPHYEWDLKYAYDDKPITLPEWRLGGPECYERKAIVGVPATDWVKAMDDTLRPKGTTVQRPTTAVFENGRIFTEVLQKSSHSVIDSKVVQSTVSEIPTSGPLDPSTLYVM